jgi:NAD(P)-dependent dehydrogenase (short-subunit alcohol dehydrogenase family)
MSKVDSTAIFRLDGKVAVVTGASSGIGRSMAQTLAGAGAIVYAVARRKDRLDALSLTAPRGSIVPLVRDLNDERSCDEVIAEVVDAEHRLDVLVNNAGTSNIAKAIDESAHDFERLLTLNLVAPFLLSRRAAAQMMTQSSGGSIVNVASIVGMVGLGRMPQAGYASSKGGLVNLTRELAAQWARKGVRVNAIAPGWFDTEMTTELFTTESGVAWVNNLTPMARPGRLDELSGPLLLLASDAGSYMTGAIVAVDGGWTAI